MADKGDHIGDVETVLRRHENSYNDNNVYNQINTNGTDVDNNQPIIVEVHERVDNGYDKVAEYEATTYKDENGFTLTASVIENAGLLPGDTIRAKLFEMDREQPITEDFVDDAGVIDRVSAIGSSGSEDGLDTRLISKRVYDWLGHSTKLLKFRNVRTGKEAEARVSRNERDNAFTFPKHARREVEAKPKDLIEIIDARGDSDTDKDVEKLIQEMHSMMMEMYNDYKESKE